MKRDVVITGIGMLTALGAGCDANGAALAAGKSGVSRITRFDATHLPTRIAAAVHAPQLDGFSPARRTFEMARLAVTEALDSSGLERAQRKDAAICLGLPPFQTGWPERFAIASDTESPSADFADLIARVAKADKSAPMIQDHTDIARRLANFFGVGGPKSVVSTACSSGSTALIMATEKIREGETDCAIVVAADASLDPEMIARFGKLSALSTRNDEPERASRPFSFDRDGFVPGEGAAALVLETLEHAVARGAIALARVSGVAEKSDCYHRVRHRPDAREIVAVIERALADASLSPDSIDYVNAHGTSTPDNDWVEYRGCKLVFGDRLPDLPVSSIKSMLGHTLSASAAIEAVACVMMLRDQVIYPTINADAQDPNIQMDIVPDHARAARMHHIVSTSFGFGGQNCALILSRVDPGLA